ncbi:MAG: hypothetical protein EOO40_03950 [Deltaproteobacteria bacterium]|nr:MAG: hypothetical protein EOO40_03950 [Deltaproteobacteria bacterium]
MLTTGRRLLLALGLATNLAACQQGVASSASSTAVVDTPIAAGTESIPDKPTSDSDQNTPLPVAGNANWALTNVGLPAWTPAHLDPNHVSVGMVVNSATQVVRLTTTLLVPPKPRASGTDFIWPGLQPYTGSPNPNNMSFGVLQPVLTWGPSCAPNQLPDDVYTFWWVSGQFVDDSGCYGGATMQVAPGDGLLMDLVLKKSVWTQTVTDLATQQSVSYTVDLRGFWQNWVLFFLEDYGDVPPPTDMVFVNTTVTLADKVSDPLVLDSEGERCFVSRMTPSADGKSFVIPRIVLRAPGVAQTYAD